MDPQLRSSLETGVYGDKVYLVTELLDGGELLDTVITRGSYTERDARAIFKSVRAMALVISPRFSCKLHLGQLCFVIAHQL
jgi:hypothetical protein